MQDFLELERRLAADPRFPAAALLLCTRVIGFFGEYPAARLLLADQGQMRVVTACLALDPDIRLAGVQALVPWPIASPNRVAAAIALMRREGALCPATVSQATGRRLERLRLSPSFAGLARSWIRAMVEPAAVFLDDPAPDLGDPLLCQRLCRDYLEGTMRPTRSLKVSNSLERAQSRRGGALLLLEVMRRALSEGPTPAFSKRAFALQFGLSRTQVVDLVQEAAAAGWIDADDAMLTASHAARTDGMLWLAKFLAIGVSVLDGSFGQRLAASRARLEKEYAQISTVPKAG
jgi:hypothetical protein